jgi:hypothetical protein
MRQTNDELFKNFLEYINNFCIPDLIRKDSENFKIALIDITRNIEKMNQTSEERLLDIIVAAHKISLKSTITSFNDLLCNYNQWLLNNYRILPLNDNEFPED